MTLSERLNSGEVLIGSFVSIAHPVVVEIAGCSGLDFVIIDMEHTCIGIETVENMVRAAAWAGIEVVVRIPRIDEALIGKLLDMGAAGIQIPQVSSREYVARAIAATKYPPSGSRGYMPFCRASRFVQMSQEEYIRKSNSETLVVTQVEGKEGLSSIKEILQERDLDVVFLGPYDLSMSLGVPGEVQHEMVLKAIDGVIKEARGVGVKVGIFANDPASARHWMDRGVNYLAVGLDMTLLANAFRQYAASIKGV